MTDKPLTLAEQFDDYIAKVYNSPLEQDQLNEVRNAFMAGVCLAYTSDRDFSGEVKSYFETLSLAADAQDRGEFQAAQDLLNEWMQQNRRSAAVATASASTDPCPLIPDPCSPKESQ